MGPSGEIIAFAYSSKPIPTNLQEMSPWPEDFSTCTLEEVMAWLAENRAWGKELRSKSNSLVNSRLAKSITQDDYLLNRQRAHEEAAECRRRASILDAQIATLRSSGQR
jgi:hypothetical protein